jgi:mannitol/fructose-specific phosphotransferase system IIA component (Ntr-type)
VVFDRLPAHHAARGAVDAAGQEAPHDAVVQGARSMSTGMERGIAIPHAAVDGLERVIAGMALVAGASGEGVNFDSIDAAPAWVVVLLLIPRPQKLLHIRTLADLARQLGSEEVRKSLRGAASPEEAWKALGRS